MKRAIVLQHMNHDFPGRFLDYFAEENLVPDFVRLFEGQTIPSLAGYDFMFVLGGAQDTWQEDEYPYLKAEKQAIREWEARPKAERDAEVAKAKERRAARCAAAQKGLITRARNRAAREAAGTKDQAKEERTEGARSATDTRGSVATPQRDSRGALR